jgi:photosystem II stability/assembly factor-like uncharacterized protein
MGASIRKVYMKQRTGVRIVPWLLFGAIAMCFLATASCGKPRRAAEHRVDTRPPAAIDFSDKFYDVATQQENIWVVGYFGKIVHSADAGRTWAVQKSDTVNSLFGVSFVDDKTGWVVGEAGAILHTKDGGTTWQKQTSPITTERLLKVRFLNDNEGYVVGSYGVVLHTADGGANWQRLESFKEDCVLNDLFFASPSEGWITGEFQTIIHTTDGGKTFQKQHGGPPGKLFGIAFKGRDGIALGTAGTTLVTANGGATWTPVKNATEDTLLRVRFTDGSHVLAIGLRGALTVSPDAGRTWSTIAIPGHYTWLCGIDSAPGAVYAVGNNGAIFVSADRKQWRRLGISLQKG